MHNRLYDLLMGLLYMGKDAVYRPIQAINPEYLGQIRCEVYDLNTGQLWSEFERILIGLEDFCKKNSKFLIASDSDLIHIPPESPLGKIIRQHKTTEEKIDTRLFDSQE